MTHFLARLVERTRGEAPRVQPIIAARFAPASVAEVEPESVNRAPLKSATEARTEPPPPIVRQAKTKQNTSVVRQKKNNLAALEREAAESSVEVVQETLLVPMAGIEKPTALNVSPRTRGSGSLRRDVLPHLQPHATELQSSPSRSRSRPAPRENPTVFASDPRPPFPPNESTLERPIVRVTIGRIDVRAAPAPAPSSRKPATPLAPKLTLDDYLKSRREGAR